MQIESSRFGSITIAEDQVITFRHGLIGLSDVTRFVLLTAGAAGKEPLFYWLQALEDPSVAFLVTDPNLFFKDYDVPIREETQDELNLADTKDGRVLVICNRVGEWLTGNLLGPLVINTASQKGEQVVLTAEKKWTHRQPLMKLQSEQSQARAAA
jgi:flagellar assembly factor FliW